MVVTECLLDVLIWSIESRVIKYTLNGKFQHDLLLKPIIENISIYQLFNLKQNKKYNDWNLPVSGKILLLGSSNHFR